VKIDQWMDARDLTIAPEDKPLDAREVAREKFGWGKDEK
jgi:hypothetical protein